MLTDLVIRQVSFDADRPRPKKLHDGRGLYLLCTPAGGRWWRFAYRWGGKPQTVSLGTLGDVTLPKARSKAQALRDLIAEGVNPAARMRAQKDEQRAGERFRVVAEEWHRKQQQALATRTKKRWLLDKMILPALGAMPIGQITTRDVVAMALAVEDAISSEAAHRAKQTVSQILRYAVATGRATRDVTTDARGALRPVVVRHRPAITDPDQIGALMRAIDGLESPVVRTALQVLALTFVRPGELRTMAWADLDLVAAVWRIPAARMKMKQAHVVPLAPQTIAALKSLQDLTGDSPYVFPAVRTPRRPMSDGTINAALRRLGYGTDEMVGHGFRAMARTILAEVLEADPFVIESQLAHATPGPLGAAYARTQYLPQRRTLMAQWADWLDQIRVPRQRAAERA
jgi:integrase